MTRNHDLVKLRDVFDDGSTWHKIDGYDPNKTECDRLIDVRDVVEHSEPGDEPNGLSGTTVCYGCTGIGDHR